MTKQFEAVTRNFDPNLGGGKVIPPSCWFNFNDSETLKAATMAYCSIL